MPTGSCSTVDIISGQDVKDIEVYNVDNFLKFVQAMACLEIWKVRAEGSSVGVRDQGHEVNDFSLLAPV